MEVSTLAPQLQQTQPLQGLNFNDTNAISLYNNTLSNNEPESILSVLQIQSDLNADLYNKLKIDLISILNEVKEQDQLSTEDLKKLELIYSILDQQSNNGTASPGDFFAILYLLSVLIF